MYRSRCYTPRAPTATYSVGTDMRPTLRTRMPWREVSARLARYRASHARVLQHDSAAAARAGADAQAAGNDGDVRSTLMPTPTNHSLR